MDEKLTAILSEREGLRNEIIELEKSNQTIVIYFFILIGSFAGLMLDKDNGILNNTNLRTILLITISQIEFLFSLFIINNFSNMNIHKGYIVALEKKINELLKEKITVWETEITGRFLFKPYRTHFLTIFFMASLMIFLFFFLIIFSNGFSINNMMRIILGIEMLILVFLVILMSSETKKVTNFVTKYF